MIDNILLLLENPVGLLNLIVSGVMLGAIFALIAYGMALVWGVMNIINLSQGPFVVFGGFIAYYVSNEWRLPVGIGEQAWFTISWSGINPLFALLIAPVVLYGIGILIYRLVIFRIVERDMFTSILATFGISIFLEQFMNGVFDAEDVIARHDLGSWLIWRTSMGELVIEQASLIALLFSVVVGLLISLYLRHTRQGQAIRAVAQNARAARIMGIDADQVYARTYALNAAICGAAGVLVAMILTIHAFAGLIYTVRAFMVVIVAGLGNVGGVIAAGLGIGAAENLASNIFGASFQTAFVAGLLIAVLLYRAVRLGRERKYLT